MITYHRQDGSKQIIDTLLADISVIAITWSAINATMAWPIVLNSFIGLKSVQQGKCAWWYWHFFCQRKSLLVNALFEKIVLNRLLIKKTQWSPHNTTQQPNRLSLGPKDPIYNGLPMWSRWPKLVAHTINVWALIEPQDWEVADGVNIFHQVHSGLVEQRNVDLEHKICSI